MATADGERSTVGDRIRRRAADLGVRRVALYVTLGLLVAFYLSPLWSGLMTAIKTQTEFATTVPYVPPSPEGFTLDPWTAAFEQLSRALLNSALFVIPATLLSATLGSMAAYGLTKIDWRGQIAVMALFVAGVFIPYQSVLVPLTLFWSWVDLSGYLAFAPRIADRSSLIELAITHTAYGVPICTVLFRAYYVTIDPELIEAARLDGASFWRIYRRIVLPLSKPMFAVTLIYQFTQIWNDLLFALILISGRANYVVTLALNELQGAFVQEYNVQMAAAFLAALPTLIVYILFGEQFAEGITTGESG